MTFSVTNILKFDGISIHDDQDGRDGDDFTTVLSVALPGDAHLDTNVDRGDFSTYSAI